MEASHPFPLTQYCTEMDWGAVLQGHARKLLTHTPFESSREYRNASNDIHIGRSYPELHMSSGINTVWLSHKWLHLDPQAWRTVSLVEVYIVRACAV